MSENKKQMTSTDVLKQVGEIRDTVELLRDTVFEDCKQAYGVDKSIFNDILRFDYDEIDDTSVDTLRSFLLKFKDKELLEDFKNAEDDVVYKEMKEIKNKSLLLLSLEMEAYDIENSTMEQLKDITPELSSKSTTNERINILKEKVDSTEDDKEKSRLNNVIKTLESTLDFSFFTERISKLGDVEINKIVKGFLYPSEGEYILKKYKAKQGKFSLETDNFKYFMNIEETFLDPEYEPFNNLFLFMYMRFIAYADPHNKKDRVYVSALTNALHSLKSHSFINQEEEDEFKAFIASVIDKFIDYKDIFIEHNTTYKGHTVRQEYDENMDKNKRNVAIEECLKFKIKYDETLSTDDLVKFVHDEKDKMIRKQVEAYRKREHLDNEENDTDGDKPNDVQESHSDDTVSNEDGCCDVDITNTDETE